MRTGGVHRRERPALRRPFLRGPISQFSMSLIVKFVVKFTLDSPAEVRTRGIAMKRLTLPAELFAIVLAWTSALPSRAYEGGAVAGGGKIDGKVVFNDAVPTRKIIPNKDVDRKSTRLNSSHQIISYAVFCLKKKNLRNTSHC